MVDGVRRMGSFGKKMRIFRESRDISQTSFEGISDKQIRRYEHGKMFPTMRSLENIANKFGVSVEQYIDEVKKM